MTIRAGCDTNILMRMFGMKSATMSQRRLISELWEMILSGGLVLVVSYYALLELLNFLRADATRAADDPGVRQERLDRSLEKYREVISEMKKYPGIVMGDPIPQSDIKQIIEHMQIDTANNLLPLNPHNQPVSHLDLLLLVDARNSGCSVFYTLDRAVGLLDHPVLLGGMRIVYPRK